MAAAVAEPPGLDAQARFAFWHSKPLCIPEWGTVATSAGGAGDDAGYVLDVGQLIAHHDVGFDSWFDKGHDSVNGWGLRRLGLSPKHPLVRAYERDPEAAERWGIEEHPKTAALATRAQPRCARLAQARARPRGEDGCTHFRGDDSRDREGSCPSPELQGDRPELRPVSRSRLYHGLAGPRVQN
jgi:hypothetical protein